MAKTISKRNVLILILSVIMVFTFSVQVNAASYTPSKTSITVSNPKANTLKVKWTKVSKNCDGYQAIILSFLLRQKK